MALLRVGSSHSNSQASTIKSYSEIPIRLQNKVTNLVDISAILTIMPSVYYQRNFYPTCYYHIYNRGAHQRLLFHDARDYNTFTQILRYYLLHPVGTPPSIINRRQNKVTNLVEKTSIPAQLPYRLLAYCLMPNHFHLMLQQVDEKITISNLMRRLSIGYAMYYNSRYHHSGTILQGRYKNILIENEMQWLYLTKYIHRNPAHNKQSYELCNQDLAHYPYSSYQNYLGTRSEDWVKTSDVLSRYGNNPYEEYREFVQDSDPGPIKRLTLDCNELQ